jgi:hypothetical protein
MKNAARVLICLSLLVLSTISFAGTLTWYILNSGDSVINPITITQSTIEYYGIGPGCANFVTLPKVQVKTGAQSSVRFDTSVVPASCWSSNDMKFYLVLSEVDGKGIDSSCTLFYDFYSPDAGDMSGKTIKVTETTDHFFCEYLDGLNRK